MSENQNEKKTIGEINFSARGIVKGIARGVVGAGTVMITKDVIKHNVCYDEVFSNRRKRIMFRAATYAIGGTVSEQTKAYTDKMVDEAFDALDQVVQVVQVVRGETSYNNGDTIQGETVKNDQS